MSWDPQQYSRFAGQRLRPALDLIARIPVACPRNVNLGCGTGNVTRILRGRWPDACITGIDGSPQMLAEARKIEVSLSWEQVDVAAWNPAEKFDVAFSNAALHWLDDHPVLFQRLCGNVAGGGVLAVQMPCNFGAASHTLMHELAMSPPPGAQRSPSCCDHSPYLRRKPTMLCSLPWLALWIYGRANICKFLWARIRWRSGPKALG